MNTNSSNLATELRGNSQNGNENSVTSVWFRGRFFPMLFVLLGLWSIIYVLGAGYPPALLDDADTVHAEAAREMAQSGDWVTLHADGIRYLEKAPLMYWLVAACYKFIGVNEFATRLPFILCVLALMLTVFAFGKYAFNQRAGFYAALIVATSPGIYLFTRVLWPDVIFLLIAAPWHIAAGLRNKGSANLEYGSYFPDAPHLFLTNEDLEKMWTGARRIYLFTDEEQLNHLTSMLGGKFYEIAQSGGKVILSNQS